MPQFPRDGPLGRDPDRSRDSDTPPTPTPSSIPGARRWLDGELSLEHATHTRGSARKNGDRTYKREGLQRAHLHCSST